MKLLIGNVFDALTCARSYKQAWPAERAFQLLANECGKQFDPDCVAAFLGQREAIGQVQAQLADILPAVANATNADRGSDD